MLDDSSRRYVYGAQGLAYSVDTGTGAVSVYHADGLGSVRALTDASGSVVQTYRTDEFGNPEPSGTLGSSSQPRQYTGEPREGVPGLLDLRARPPNPGDVGDASRS